MSLCDFTNLISIQCQPPPVSWNGWLAGSTELKYTFDSIWRAIMATGSPFSRSNWISWKQKKSLHTFVNCRLACAISPQISSAKLPSTPLPLLPPIESVFSGHLMLLPPLLRIGECNTQLSESVEPKSFVLLLLHRSLQPVGDMERARPTIKRIILYLVLW